MHNDRKHGRPLRTFCFPTSYRTQAPHRSTLNPHTHQPLLKRINRA